MSISDNFGLDFTLRELQIIERAILHLQYIEQNKGHEELAKLFPSGFNIPDTYWELKALEDKVIKRKSQTPEMQIQALRDRTPST